MRQAGDAVVSRTLFTLDSEKVCQSGQGKKKARYLGF
jgi:hypothetical protein